MITLIKEISPNQIHWRNDSRVNAWTRQNGILSYADQMKWLEKIESDPSIMMFGVWHEAYGNVGTCGLTDIRPIHGTAEFSLLIDPSKHGQGYGKLALIELLKYGFKHLRLNLIWGETFTSNPAYKMFKKLGMKDEGRPRERYFKSGEYLDTFMVSITANEARSQKWW